MPHLPKKDEKLIGTDDFLNQGLKEKLEKMNSRLTAQNVDAIKDRFKKKFDDIGKEKKDKTPFSSSASTLKFDL